MKPKTEQVEAILSWDTFRWACDQLQDRSDIDQKKYTDFIEITEEEIYQFVHKHGFNSRAVYICTNEDRWDNFKSDDHLCIVQDKDKWLVFYTERGQRSETAVFNDRKQAEIDVIKRLIVSAKISLNCRYINAHPHLNLPKPSEMN
jgi:rhodanese-related sulfurtransferase